ncbi:MAG TPA: hypothetical protein VHF01_02630 [Candidatus Acidoferrum sp.]|nr:hypothetical protein [Candidatus Acidoferrum sp.]
MSSRTRKDAPRIQHLALSSPLANFLASDEPRVESAFIVKERPDKLRLWKGLARFVNCGDSEGERKALQKAFPDLCVFPIYLPEARELFLYYRDALRRVWEGDRRDTRLFHDVGFLLGLNDFTGRFPSQFLSAENSFRSVIPAVAYSHREARLRPDWESGDFLYGSMNNFQRAFYLLFRESWRARVCPQCNTYFVGEKPRQKFCSLSCSNRSRLASNLNWYHRVGVGRRRKQSQQMKRRKK